MLSSAKCFPSDLLSLAPDQIQSGGSGKEDTPHLHILCVSVRYVFLKPFNFSSIDRQRMDSYKGSRVSEIVFHISHQEVHCREKELYNDIAR